MSELCTEDLNSIGQLITQGKSENFKQLVLQHRRQLTALRKAVERVRQIAPDVAVSPYIARAARIIDESLAGSQEGKIEGSISAAA